MPIIYEAEGDRPRLLRTAEDEAIDLQTGQRYRLERVDNHSSLGVGLVIGLFLALVFLLATNDHRNPSPNPQNNPAYGFLDNREDRNH